MSKRMTIAGFALALAVGGAIGLSLEADGAIRTVTTQYDDANVVFVELRQERLPTGGPIRLVGCAVVPKLDGGFMGLDRGCVPCGTVTGGMTVVQMAAQCLPVFQNANNL